jgi:hypothetical protein
MAAGSSIVRHRTVGFLTQQGGRDAIRRHLAIGVSRVFTLHERKLYTPNGQNRLVVPYKNQAASEQLDDNIIDLAILLRRADPDSAHQLIGQIQRGFHITAYRFTGYMGLCRPGTWLR